MTNFNAKRIADPVHGTIGLSDLEVSLINTKPFQRLRNIKHLGLAHFVFPGGDFSRFEHSLGVCHITGRILENLKNNFDSSINNDDIKLYRLAALLHDIGHYPFSHVIEDVIRDYYSDAMLKKSTSSPPQSEKYFLHERLSKEILLNDVEIKHILEENGFKPENISSIFMREDPKARFMNLISSDLDADRIDFLLRTALHTGLPYGSVDIDYLLSQIKIDDKNFVCFDLKALRTADHLLLSRYFDRLQVAYHKTVAGFELVLKDVLEELFNRNSVDFSANSIKKLIENGEWSIYDDAFLINELRKLLEDDSTFGVIKVKIKSILNRTPPKLVALKEYLDNRDHETDFLLKKESIKNKVQTWANDFEIDGELWYAPLYEPLSLTKSKRHALVSTKYEDIPEDKKEKYEYEQVIRIFDKKSGQSKPIIDYKSSLMSVLSDYSLYILRVYVLFPENNEDKRKKIERRILIDLPFMN